MIALHFERLLSQQQRNFTLLWCINQFTTAERKQRSALQVISVHRCRSLLPTTGIINEMQCDARVSLFLTLFYQQTFT